MKTMVEKRVVPQEQIEIVKYGCDVCDFMANDKRAVEDHYAKKHACKAEIKAGGKTLYRFDSEEDANAWLRLDDWSRVREVDWSGPGWYATETWTQPCPRNCCTDHCVRLFSAERFVSEAIERARQIMYGVEAIRSVIRQEAHG